MKADTIAAVVTALVMLLGMIGAILALTFRIGALSGSVSAFMATHERDRSEMLKDIGRLEERYERHIENHHGGTS